MEPTITIATLWGGVILSGIYHGLNPAMGWPLAVSAALIERKKSTLFSSLNALAIGHFFSVAVILLPFSFMSTMVVWESQVRVTAGVLVVGFGIYLLVNRRHPRFLARVSPTNLVLWSFLVALAHGAGLMLVPIFLGICMPEQISSGHRAASMLMSGSLGSAILVAVIHTLAMIFSGGVLAIVIYFWLGLKSLRKTFFNIDIVWAFSLIVVGTIGIYLALT
jgi:hypothetical protein